MSQLQLTSPWFDIYLAKKNYADMFYIGREGNTWLGLFYVIDMITISYHGTVNWVPESGKFDHIHYSINLEGTRKI